MPIPKYVRWSPLNRLRFVKVNTALPVGFHMHHFDDAIWLEQQQKDYKGQTFIPYASPIEQNEYVSIYFDTTGYEAEITLYKLGPLPTLISTWNLTGPYILAGNTYQGQQMKVFLMTLQMLYSPGYYQFQVKVTFDGGSTKTYHCEPFNLRQSWPDTLHIRYSHHKNDHEILFEQLNPLLSNRFFGSLREYDPGSRATVYEGQNNELKVLSSDTWRNHVLHIDGEGIPDWLIEKLAWIAKCSNIQIDGKGFTRETGANVEKKPFPGSPLSVASLKLREAKHDNYVDDSSVVSILQIASYPCAIPNLPMMNSNNLLNFTFNVPKVFASQADLEAFKVWLNTQLALHMMSGAFSRVDDEIQYTNGPGETWVDTMWTNLVLYKRFIVTIQMPAATAWQYSHYYGGYHVTDWGDATNPTAHFSANTTSVNASHTFVNAGSYDVTIYHNDFQRHFGCIPSTYGQRIRDFGGVVPIQLRYFDVRYANHSALTNVNPSFLYPCKANIQTLIWSNSQIRAFSPALFTGSFVSANWGQLIWCDLRNNKFTSGGVDAFFNGKYQSGTTSLGSAWLIQGQSPAAPPTNTSLFSRQAMQVVLGCQVGHD